MNFQKKTQLKESIIYIIAAIAGFSILASCGKEDVSDMRDYSGVLYAVWALDSKTEITNNSEGEEIRKYEDYSSFHFYLSFAEVPFPHAIAKKGSFTSFDLDDVDVDWGRFTYNEDKKQISFDNDLWLSEGIFFYMRLSGTFDVLELSEKTLTLRQESLGIITIFSYHKYK